MHPAASDEPSHQHHQSSDDNNASSQGQPRANPESESSAKGKKKGKNGTKAKDKVNNTSTAKMTPEDLTQPTPPLKSEPSPYQNNAFGRPPGNNIVSPVLEALGSLASTQDNDTAFRTDAWTKSIPIGKSPPADPVDGGFVSESPLSFPTNAEKGGFSRASTSTSPPLGRARPMSYGGGYPSITPSRHQSVDRHKRHSSSHFPSQPPLPHLPQAHFYGAPEIDLPLFSGQGRPPTDANYSFCAFDTISSSPSFKSTKMGGKVLVVGSDGALEVLAIEDQKTRPIGRIVGLNGRVIDAKLLPWTSQADPFASSRPHVAVIVHGPVCQKDDGGGSSSSGSEQNDSLSGLAGKQTSFEKQHNRDETIYYQTKVEIYSLRTGEHITTLFTSKPVPCFDNFPGLPLYAPAPVGNLKLYASGNFVIVASGVSGEVYIYGVGPSSAPTAYQCLAKTWTSVQSRSSRRYSASSSSTDPDGSQADSPRGSASPDSPILSLSGRWLAIVPPSSTSRPPLHGTVPASLVQRKIYGLDTHIPPSRPAVTCVTDAGEEESFLNKFARGVTQELFRGARWMGDQGLQAWNSYWNKDQQSSQTATSRRPMQPMEQQGYNIFPPTHAQDTQTSSPAEPDLVSLIDLKRLEDNPEVKASFPSPVATFQVPHGCSFLSFSPNGLMLFTASKKGDIQYVWDLMQVKNCRAGAFLSDDPALPTVNAHVRQVARYARLTTSSIVDVIWTAPTGERLAIITRKGTVHVFDLPRSAFQWPPLRRARPLPAKPQNDESAVEESSETTTSGNPFTAAMKLVGDKTQPILAAVRGRAPSVGPAFPSVSSFGISPAAGGKAVAAGLSKSVGAATGTVNTLRHAGENRLHLSGFSKDPAASRVAWFCNKDEPLLGVIDGGYFKLYRIARSLATRKNRQGHSIIGGKVTEFKLPAHLQNPCGPIQVGTLNTDSAVSASWALPSSKPHSSSTTKLKSQPLSQAEIETNAPYQPFHTDQRINLYVFPSGDDANQSVMASITGPWVFGNDIPMSKLHVRPVSRDDDDEDNVHEKQAGASEIENHITLGNGGHYLEEVVITTRRKKKKHTDPFAVTSSGIDDDGFFEDDCEVLDFARDRV